MKRILIGLAYGVGGMFVCVVIFAVLGTVFGIPSQGTAFQVATWCFFLLFGYFGLRGRKKAKPSSTSPPGDV